jgi:hypothetical protein
MNTSTKQLARLNIHLERIAPQMTSNKQSLAADGHWYYVMSGFIEATFGSALVTYKLSLNGRLNLIFNINLFPLLTEKRYRQTTRYHHGGL